MSAVRFVLRHRLERNRRPPVAPGPLEQRLEKRLGGRFLAAEAQQREHGRRARRPKQLLEQHGAVRVGPLQVVDPDDQRLGDPRAGAAARAAPRMPGAGGQADRRSRAPDRRRASGDSVHLQQHREHSRQRRHVGRQQLFDLLTWNRREIAAQVVDDAVERLVRHRLVLVAAAGEHDDVVARAELAEKAPHQRALADA